MTKLRESRVTRALRDLVRDLETMSPEHRVELMISSGQLRAEDGPAAVEKLKRKDAEIAQKAGR